MHYWATPEVVPVEDLMTVSQVEAAMEDVLEYWIAHPEPDPKAAVAQAVYKQLMARKKKVTVQAQQAGPSVTDVAVAQAQQVLEALCKEDLLAVSVEAMDPIVAMGHSTLETVLKTIFAVQRQMVVAKADPQLTSDAARMAFATLLDQKIATKIQTRLKGSKGAVYQAAFEKAYAKHHGGTAPAVSPPPSAEPAPPKKKKSSKKKAAVVPSTWCLIADALVTVPSSVSEALSGKVVVRISSRIWSAMQVYMEEERARWAEQGVPCSDLLLRHNYLTMLLMEGPQAYQLAPAGDGLQGVELWITGEQMPATVTGTTSITEVL